MHELLIMCLEFFKTGLFAIGGGLATLPFLSEMTRVHPNWFSLDDLSNMLAISESTPGPIGVNMSTFVGFKNFGILGGVLTSLSLVLPSFIIILILSKIWEKYKTSEKVTKIFSALRPAAIGLILSAGFSVFISAVFVMPASNEIHSLQNLLSSVDIRSLLLFAAIMFGTNFRASKDLHPVAFIAFAGIVGVVLQL